MSLVWQSNFLSTTLQHLLTFGYPSLKENSFGKVSSFQVDSFKTTFCDVSSSEVGEAHITVENPCIIESGTSKINISEDPSTQLLIHNAALTHVGSSKIGSSNSKVTATNSSGIEFQSRQIESAKVPLPSIVSIQQLNSSNLSYNSTFLLNTIHSTAQTLWQNTTSINLNFEITALRTGWLAEAQVTSASNGWGSKGLVLTSG